MSIRLTALYYPHIAIQNEGLLKNALLLWDNIELICPFGELPRRSKDLNYQSAFSSIARPLLPSDTEKQKAHDAVIELADSKLPQWFFPENVNKNLRYGVYPDKFLPETWEALQRSKLAQPKELWIDPPMPSSEELKWLRQAKEEAYVTTQAMGLTMMSILADCCAGGTKQLVTDEASSYLALDRYLKVIGGAKPIRKSKSYHDRLVTLSLVGADVSRVSLSSLVALRKREERQPELRAMRHHYVNKVDDYIRRLSTQARSERDVREIERVFQQEVSDDIHLLKEELKEEAKSVIFSKEFATAAIAMAGTFIEPLGNAVAAGALYRSLIKFRKARRRVLEQHSMSWLYQTKQLQLY
ncbi:MAG: hypothetical protein OXI35_02825 [Gemmatimonadota bacterium]|nr:hypothetical protein [Gemmatimonadota bacterium]